MHYYPNTTVHQFSPIKTIHQAQPHIYTQPVIQAQSHIQPATYSNVRYLQNQPAFKQSTLSTFQPYKPDPEVERIISKYTASTKGSQIGQPITHQPSNSFHQASENQFKQDPFQYYDKQEQDFQNFKDVKQTNNNIPLHFQLDEVKQRQPQNIQKNYSPEVNEFKDFSPEKQTKHFQPEQNDKIVKAAVTGIIVILVLYIISMLFLN